MYLWKYWRESRVVFGVAVLLIAFLFVQVLREHMPGNGTAQLEGISMMFVAALYFQAVVFSLFGWAFGSFGVGRDLGEKSGSYLFSKPRSRAFFVWSDWGYGMLQLFIILILANLVFLFQIHLLSGIVTDPMPGYLRFPNRAVPFYQVVLTTFCAEFLVVGLVFSLTYFFTVLMKHSRGVLAGAAVITGYLVGGVVLHHYWPGIKLPGLVVQEFTFNTGPRHSIVFTGIADHLWLPMIIRAGIVLLFPLASQMLLERRDI